MAVLIIDGVDFTNCVSRGGFKWQGFDIDGPNAGRNKRGTMIRDIIARKTRADVTCRPLPASKNAQLLKALRPAFVTVVCTDAEQGTATKVVYSNNQSSDFLMRRPDGTEWWHNTQFPLIER